MAVTLILVACGGGAAEPEASRAEESAAPAAETTVSVVLAGETQGVSGRDYSLTSDPGSAPAGKVTFDVEVESGLHALTVIRTDLPPDQLPTTDGTSFVDITDERIEVMGFHEESESNFSLETQLETSSYVLICNVGGHYTSGMRTAFDVS